MVYGCHLADLVPMDVPRILINRYQAGTFGRRKNDIILEGELVEIVLNLAQLLDWKLEQ